MSLSTQKIRDGRSCHADAYYGVVHQSVHTTYHDVQDDNIQQYREETKGFNFPQYYYNFYTLPTQTCY